MNIYPFSLIWFWTVLFIMFNKLFLLLVFFHNDYLGNIFVLVTAISWLYHLFIPPCSGSWQSDLFPLQSGHFSCPSLKVHRTCIILYNTIYTSGLRGYNALYRVLLKHKALNITLKSPFSWFSRKDHLYINLTSSVQRFLQRKALHDKVEHFNLILPETLMQITVNIWIRSSVQSRDGKTVHFSTKMHGQGQLWSGPWQFDIFKRL